MAKHHAMKRIGGVEAKYHTFFTSIPSTDGANWWWRRKSRVYRERRSDVWSLTCHLTKLRLLILFFYSWTSWKQSRKQVSSLDPLAMQKSRMDFCCWNIPDMDWLTAVFYWLINGFEVYPAALLFVTIWKPRNRFKQSSPRRREKTVTFPLYHIKWLNGHGSDPTASLLATKNDIYVKRYSICSVRHA